MSDQQHTETASSRLDPEQQRAATKLIEHQGVWRHTPVVVALAGSHAYGCPSPQSDVDIAAVHLDPTESFLGLDHKPSFHQDLSVATGVTIDFRSHELAEVLRGVLRGNGNYLECVLGGIYFVTSPLLADLQRLSVAALSKRTARHYGGISRGLLTECERKGPSVKRILGILRTALTGTHLLRTGQVLLDLPLLLDLYGLREALTLVAHKKSGPEGVALSEYALSYWQKDVALRALHLLTSAEVASTLPDTAPNEAEVNDWLVQVRLRALPPR